MSNPWNGKVILQVFWWNCWNQLYPYDWYTFLAKLAPRIKNAGFDGIWTPPPVKGDSGQGGMGYDPFDYYDIGNKNQKGSVNTRFGTQDAFLRLIAVAHANGLEVYPDIVLDHCDGGPGKNYNFAGAAAAGRWPRSWLDFHMNPLHSSLWGDWPSGSFGDDFCFQGRCCDTGNGNQNCYARAGARDWLVWFQKQTDADGFRFDDVRGYPPEVVEDMLYNSMGPGTEYFTVGEFVPDQGDPAGMANQDSWAAGTQNRSGTFDYFLRFQLVKLVQSGGYFDMGSLPNYQQQNRYKTVPFVNNHDSYLNLGPGLDPTNQRTQLAYAFVFAIDGNPEIYYEDFFVNVDPQRNGTTADALPTRFFIENLVWCHQKLEFKAGAYKVRYQGSQQLLIIERSARAIIGLNNDGVSWHDAWIATDFGPNVELHDYSGSMSNNIWTNQDGWVDISVPPCSYSIWGPVGISGGFAPASRRTTQEFQMDDDLGDLTAAPVAYGGKLVGTGFRTAGSVWAAANSAVNVWIYLDDARTVDLRIFLPDPATGNKSQTSGALATSGPANAAAPLIYQFVARNEGYHQFQAQLANPGDAPTRAYVKVDYLAPVQTALF